MKTIAILNSSKPTLRFFLRTDLEYDEGLFTIMGLEKVNFQAADTTLFQDFKNGTVLDLNVIQAFIAENPTLSAYLTSPEGTQTQIQPVTAKLVNITNVVVKNEADYNKLPADYRANHPFSSVQASLPLVAWTFNKNLKNTNISITAKNNTTDVTFTATGDDIVSAGATLTIKGLKGYLVLSAKDNMGLNTPAGTLNSILKYGTPTYNTSITF